MKISSNSFRRESFSYKRYMWESQKKNISWKFNNKRYTWEVISEKIRQEINYSYCTLQKMLYHTVDYERYSSCRIVKNKRYIQYSMEKSTLKDTYVWESCTMECFIRNNSILAQEPKCLRKFSALCGNFVEQCNYFTMTIQISECSTINQRKLSD